MAVPRVGSASWQDASYRTINWAYQLRQRPLTAACLTTNGQKHKQEESSRREYVQTLPPFHRDLVAETSNVLARGYMRDTKHLMVHLRQVLGEIGRNIQRLQRMRHRLEHTHANIRRDILTNKETIQLRTIRPKKEMQPDMVDTLLKEEKTGLMDVKQGSEQQLQLQEISRQLQVLYHHRQILSEFCKEKSQVLEIVNETVSPCALGQETTGFNKLLSQQNADCLTEINNAIVTCEMLQKTLPLKWNKVMEIQALKERVTRGLHIKADESLKIREDLILALGKTRNYIQKQQKLQNEIKTSYISQLGPVSTLDLSVRERLDRPLIKVLQRHPGTQVPESTLILKGTAVLEQAVEKSCRKIDFQELARSKLEEDAKSKLWGERIDKTAVRMRKRTTSGGRERLCL